MRLRSIRDSRMHCSHGLTHYLIKCAIFGKYFFPVSNYCFRNAWVFAKFSMQVAQNIINLLLGDRNLVVFDATFFSKIFPE